MGMISVDILMATYNGEKFIESQISSLCSQKYKNWKLLIHDDGSTDQTISLIKKWQKFDSRIFLIEDGVKCGGASANFMHLIKYSTADFIMFCDQDDIWFDNKISTMLDCAADMQKEIPSVVYGNAYTWIPNSGISGTVNFYKCRKLKDKLFINGGPLGCLSIFNKSMKNYLLDWEMTPSMHDHALIMIALTLGSIEYIDTPLMLYRRHEGTVTNNTEVRAKNIVESLRGTQFPVVNQKHYDDWKYFLTKYGAKIEPKQKLMIENYLELPSKNLLFKIKSILSKKYSLFGSTPRLISKVILRKYM